MDEAHQQIHEIYDRINETSYDAMSVWVEHELFSGMWWLALSMAVLPWVAWFLFRRRESADRLQYAGLVLVVISSFLDFIGSQVGAWRYMLHLFPVVPSFAPWDFSMYPVAGMFFLQVKPAASPVLKGLLFAAASAFVAEPLFEWIGIYEPVNWHPLYSFPIHWLLYMLMHWVSRRNRFEPLA